jgi:CotH kinase protein
MHIRLLVFLVALATAALLPAHASAQTWPAVFDPTQVLTFHLQLAESDWDTIRHDLTNEIEVPAWFHSDGETPILVSVRRKSSRALPSESDPQKVGLKIDVNELVSGQEWHGVVKLSLENGGDAEPISEGLAWNLHERASVDGFYGSGYHPALAAWVRLFVNGRYVGVYANVEQRDRRFLENRGLFVRGASWLYEIDDINSWALEVGDPHSPTFGALCYSPFQPAKGASTCPTPTALAEQLPQYIDMQAMLTQGAVDALTGNQDALFSHGKNYFFADFVNGLRRYYPWDLDAVFTGQNVDIYGKRSGKRLVQTPFQSVILGNPTFRPQYRGIILGLTDPAAGPLSEPTVHAFLNSVEPLLSPALAADPYAGVPDPAGLFQSLRERVSARIASVRAQAAAE